jgi:signal transduction histidine kinase
MPSPGGWRRGTGHIGSGMRTDRGRSRLYGAGWLISAGVTLVAFRMWHLHLREVEQRAEEAERTRDEVARRRAVEERLRIARELHDSLTHSISVIRVQANVAAHLARKRGDEVPSALLAIMEASEEREVVALAAHGLSNDEIASRWCSAPAPSRHTSAGR